MTRRVGLYPGTFDPITNGHLDIIRRAVKLVDHLVIGVAINEGKGPMFSLEERVEMVRHEAERLRGQATIEVRPFKSLLMQFAEEVGAQMIVRGLRAVSDFESELQMAHMNQSMAPEIDTVFFMTAVEHAYLSSSLVREIAAFGGDVSSMVPEAAALMLRRRNAPA